MGAIRRLVGAPDFRIYLEQFPSSIVDRVDANGSPAEVLYAILKSIIPVQNKLFEADQDD